MKIKFAKCNEKAIIPTKRQEDAGFDLYVLKPKEDFYILKPNETKLLPTGLKSIIEQGYYVQIQERGSTGSKGIKYSAGVIDSNYRGEWFLACTNSTDKLLIIGDAKEAEDIFEMTNVESYDIDNVKSFANTIYEYATQNNLIDEVMADKILIYDIQKALFQGIVHKVPVCEIQEISEAELSQDVTDRGEGKLGSSGK